MRHDIRVKSDVYYSDIENVLTMPVCRVQTIIDYKYVREKVNLLYLSTSVRTNIYTFTCVCIKKLVLFML